MNVSSHIKKARMTIQLELKPDNLHNNKLDSGLKGEEIQHKDKKINSNNIYNNNNNNNNDIVESDDLDESYFFTNNVEPLYINELINKCISFIQQQRSILKDQKIVLVTSGGTIVPLENNTVRYIDNFSTGSRGATSAEWFLQNNYSVIFLYRKFSLTPFNRFFQRSKDGEQFLDFFNNDGTIKSKFTNFFMEQKTMYDKYTQIDNPKLLLLPYVTINEYLWSLREIGKLMNDKNCLFYLAAAVSDFFVPFSKLPKHKIQSRDYLLNDNGENDGDDDDESIKDELSASTNGSGNLIVKLDPVPKFLSKLVNTWAHGAMIVSFKLETDEKILIDKCKYALNKYNHQLVIGNLLDTKENEVIFIGKKFNDKISKNYGANTNLLIKNFELGNAKNIEEIIVPNVIELHKKWVDYN